MSKTELDAFLFVSLRPKHDAKMYSLKETWYRNYSQDPSTDWDGKIICIALDAEMTFKANETEGHSLHYSFTIVTQGWLKFIYNGQVVTIKQDDLFIYSPGQPLNILSACSDYHAVSILIDEQTALEIPTVRHLVSIAYKPLTLLHGPVLSLSKQAAENMANRVREMIGYFHAPHFYKSQILQQLFSVFLLDAQNLLELANDRQQPPQRLEELFIAFLRLLSEHFVAHHNISFYAERMNISPSYLSRIVKQLTKRTVAEYINQLLSMEASFLLATTSLSVSQISDRLHFADVASFSKFFLRLKGISPKDYRKISMSARH